ncbi:MAG: hypothetical protein A2Y45_04805 [Tenericutes bacterium GWC2_34_14]|nr:MAG: hypothetical protein A2Z84_00950 [Tenericutes bacterium GWA2_35_7]OHE29117.1 MAG: hypothetical protein A2Y45_04805 [Tenericutes bacterium GWC2_34_14]OHE34077.1 MAG: hypothetical protein A2012_05460 [Tenericutes bacterium GWE2_34_108]OHE35407.1 MAG: hypothetical protein A2Y46_04805 [Tenericutes bacterium GWF1_35_14]OHE38447.1 MAG: hypothetical protein A2Y44_07940 [Tenericutes bacterium GWF2_35_184]OHE42603.1 MAG: hypothetical protein A3K26_00445 [Tenericutes bacterium RIFOXYA12_FULL_35_
MNNNEKLINHLRVLKIFFPFGFAVISILLIFGFSFFHYYQSIPEGGNWNEGNYIAFVFSGMIVFVSFIVYLLFFKKKISTYKSNIDSLINEYKNNRDL